MTATEKKQTVTLSPEVLKAIAWLDRVTEPDGGVRRRIDMSTGELGTISTEITGYAAHLFAWLALVTERSEYTERAKLHADWIIALWGAPYNDRRFLPFEPGSDLTYFFDCGIASRGIQMTSLAGKLPIYALIANSLATYMLRFHDGKIYRPICNRRFDRVIVDRGWWSSEPGPHQNKAGLAIGATPWKPEASSEPIIDGNLFHPLAYWGEWLLLSGSLHRAANVAAHIEPWTTDLYRCDALAQSLRLRMLLDNEDIGARVDVEDKLVSEFQDSSGGFWFAKRGGEIVPHLSTHATIFAIQAMVMSEMEEIPDFGELSII